MKTMTKRRPPDTKTKLEGEDATDKARVSLVLFITGVTLVVAGLLHSLGYF